jgi:carbon monoxide dehydrogenase subunit G
MPLTFEIRETIAAPPTRVFEAFTDLDRMGEWMQGFIRNERLTPGALGKGSQFRQWRRMFGREASEVFEVSEFEPPDSFALFVDGAKGSSRGGWFKIRHAMAPAGAGTALTLSVECGGASGCLALLGKFVFGPMMKKSIAKDLEAFKRWVERDAA